MSIADNSAYGNFAQNVERQIKKLKQRSPKNKKIPSAMRGKNTVLNKKIRMAKEAATRTVCFRFLGYDRFYFLFMNLHFQLNGIENFVRPSLVSSILTPMSRSPMFCGSANVA